MIVTAVQQKTKNKSILIQYYEESSRLFDFLHVKILTINVYIYVCVCLHLVVKDATACGCKHGLAIKFHLCPEMYQCIGVNLHAYITRVNFCFVFYQLIMLMQSKNANALLQS